MKKGSTLFLKGVIVFIGLVVLAICISIIVDVIKHGIQNDFLILTILLVVCISAIPFFGALYQGFKLLTYVDTNTAFSELSVKALKNIKICALTISCLYVPALPLFYQFAQLDDAPGVVVIGMICVGGPVVVAVFAAVLEKLLYSAISIKSENELTV